MSKANTKTVESTKSVSSFVKTIEKDRQNDCTALIGIIKNQSGFEPKMWGPSIVGFGSYHYKYESGREGDAPLIGFSPRKSEFALYVGNFDGKDDLLKKLGRYKKAKACVYIRKLGDIDIAVLEQLIDGSIKHYQSKYK